MKVDVSKIDGYESMSVEDKIKALEGYEFEDPKQNDDGEVKKLKEALSKSNSEAASWKRQLHEKMSEEEKKEAERKEQQQKIEDELTSLRRDKTIATLEKAYLAAGYSPELATASATAQAEGDTETVLRNQLAFIADTKKALESAALNKQPQLSVGKPPAGQPQTVEDKIVAEARMYAGL